MITDTHLGVRNSLEEWIDIHRDYFYKHFLPLVKREYRPGDILIHLGDVFDSRHALTLKVLNMAIDIFEELGKIFVDGVFVIAGNHDCFYKSTTDVNSLRPLAWIPNIHVFGEPQTIKVSNSKLLLMPWRKDHAADLSEVQAYGPGHDYLFCHMDVYGMKSSRFSAMDTGIDTKAFSIFKQVYSGHIHYAQKIDNVTMLGTPYELTRSDMYNKKGITILTPDTGEEQFFENDFSPKFINMTMTALLERSPEQLKDSFKNCFVDIRVDSANFLKIPVNSILDLLDAEYKSISFIPPGAASFDKDALMAGADDELKDFDIMDSIKTYAENSPYDEDTKKKLVSSLTMLMQRAKEALDIQ